MVEVEETDGVLRFSPRVGSCGLDLDLPSAEESVLVGDLRGEVGIVFGAVSEAVSDGEEEEEEEAAGIRLAASKRFCNLPAA